MYLQEKAGDIPSCLRSFFNNENVILQAKAFEWIEDNFARLEREESGESVNRFKSNVLPYIGTLAELDPDKTVKLVKTQFDEDHNLPISALEAKPEAQLQYIDSWNRSEASAGISLPKDMLEVYLHLLCKYRPSELLAVLKTVEDIPYESCLQMCQAKGLTDSVAYLYETQGDHKGALDTYIQVTTMQILEDRRIRLQDRMSGGQVLSKFEMNELKEVIGKAMMLCIRSNEDADSWYSLMDKIFLSFKTFMPYFEGYKRIEEILTEGISEILGKIVVHLDLDEVVSRLVDSFKGIPFKVYGTELVTILQRYSFQKRLLMTAQGSMGAYLKDLAHSGLMLRQQGVSCPILTCTTCHKPLISTAQARMYVCGHGKHMDCAREEGCDLCQMQTSKQEKMRGILEKSRIGV